MGGGTQSTEPIRYPGNPAFQLLARDYLGITVPAGQNGMCVVQYGVLRCPNKAVRLGSSKASTTSYVAGQLVRVATFGEGSNRIDIDNDVRTKEEVWSLYGKTPPPGWSNFEMPMDVYRATNASAYALMFDEAIADGFAAWDSWSQSGQLASPPSNHDPQERPRLNAIFADGSVDSQVGNWSFKADCYGRGNVGPSTTFVTWYAPLPRRAPFPY